MLLYNPNGIPDDSLEIELHAIGDSNTREIEEFAKETTQPVTFSNHQTSKEPFVLIRVRGTCKLFNRRSDRCKRVFDLMCQRGGKFSDRLQPFGA